MSDPYEPPRPRDDALESELESLHQQEEEGHATPKEQRRAEQLEHRLQVDKHGEGEGGGGPKWCGEAVILTLAEPIDEAGNR